MNADLEILRGAVDLHVHASPDSVPRAQSAWELAAAAAAAGMAGVGLKDHCAPTVGRCAVLNAAHRGETRFFSSIVLNPTVGGINPEAVRAALGAGCDIVYFPTFGARHQIETQGVAGMPFPLPDGFGGIAVAGGAGGGVLPEVREVLRLVAAHDAVLATGHIAPAESLALLEAARDEEVSRLLVTHASEPVPGMSVSDQRRCVELGALVEHCLMACTACCSPAVPLEEIARQIREVGVDHVVVSSDFGQVPNGPPVSAFADHLHKLRGLGFTGGEIRKMVSENPKRLVNGRGNLFQ